MFSNEQFTGSSLPEKTLCLTFDDGPGETAADRPGPKTLQLAEYLHDQNILATFFMVGKFVINHPHIPRELSKLGHIIGNHTYNHPDMQKLFYSGGDLIAEITRTDELIMNWIPGNTIFFRAPFGLWLPEISEKLNRGLGNEYTHIGPFHWDIERKDWAYWRDCRSARECADAYLEEITKTDHGIVLLHDSCADLAKARINNLTFETIKLLVPRLKSLGYKFVKLDQLPALSNTMNDISINTIL